MSKPTFFIVGAPKCGTTALSEYLSTHPNIFITVPKEPHYFATDFPEYRAVDNEEDYRALFQDATDIESALGEASVFYLYSQEAAANIKRYADGPRIIAMVRNPVDLVYSLHSQLLYSRDESERDFQTAWSLLIRRKSGKDVPRRCREPKLLYYDEIGKIGEQVQRMVSTFGRDNVKIVLFEEFVLNTQRTYADVLKFIGVPDDRKSEFPIVNPNSRHRSLLVGNITNRPPSWLVTMLTVSKQRLGVKKLNILPFLSRLNTETIVRRPLDDEFRMQIVEKFLEDIDLLASIIDKDLSHWKS